MDIYIVAVVLIAIVFFIAYADIKKNKDEPNENPEDISKVEITDIRMSFISMVVFMIKWVIASIPAMIILGLLFVIFIGVIDGIATSLR